MSIQIQLRNLQQRLANYRLKHDKSEAYELWMEQLERAIVQHLEASQMELDHVNSRYQDMLDQLNLIIKKQALIIEAAGIQFPTINQPIQVIYDTYLASTKQYDQIPTKLHPNEIPVTIKVI
jgi:exonuclease VII small subunit